MGSELMCKAVFGKQSGEGKALLETNEILFRGPFRLKIPLKSISAIEAKSGKLHVTFPDGKATFELGPAAEKWLEKIRNPRSLLDKLGVKPESRVAVDGIGDQKLLRQIRERVPKLAESDCDILFFGADDTAALKRLRPLQKRIK